MSSSAAPGCSRSVRSASSRVGAFAAGVLTVPLESKTGVLPDLFPILRDHTVGNVASLVAGRGRWRRLRVPRRPAADAPLRSRRRHRHLRRARDHAQPPARMDEDRARRDDAVARAGDDRPPAGDRRCAARDRGRVRVPTKPARPQGPRDAGGSRCRAGGRRQRPPAAPVGVHALGCALRVRRRSARAHARLDHHRAGLSGADLPDPRDARHRRRHEPLGRRHRSARGQRPRLGARQRRRRDQPRLHARPARGFAARHPGCADGADADPAAVRDHRRSRAAAAAGGAPHEGLHRRLRRRRVAVRRQSRLAGGRRGVGVRPGRRRTWTRSTSAGCG